MTDDLILKSLTGLMLEQKSMTDAHKVLARTVASLAVTVDSLTEASERQEKRFEELLGVMTEFTATSVDTRKRVDILEREVEKLKDAS